MPLAISLDDVEQAAKRIADEAIHTPVMTCRTLNKLADRCGRPSVQSRLVAPMRTLTGELELTRAH